jgi:SulP family sulfate permease
MAKPKFNPVSDVISGIIMAATSVPQLVAYAEIVGYAGARGLSTAGPTLFAWGISTGSPFMSAGVTSITALMAKTDLGGESYSAEHGEEAYVKLVAAYSFYVGLASCLLALVGFGKLAQKCPKPVKSGFKWGCAVGVVASAVPNGFFNSASELKSVVKAAPVLGDMVIYLKTNLSAATGAVNVVHLLYGVLNPLNWAIVPSILFVLSTVFVMKAPKYLPKACPSGTEVIIATAVATAFSMTYDYQGGVVGEIPEVDPDAGFSLGPLRVPVEFLDVKEVLFNVDIAERFGGSYIMLMVSATLFAAVNFLSIMGIAAGFEVENGISWSANRELIAQGAACGMAGLVGSAPISGSMSRSLVSRMAGTTSQMSCLVTALVWIYMLPYMSVMSPTPKAALSAVIISAVLKSVLVPKDLMKLKGVDFLVGWATGLGTAVTSPTIGFALGLVFYFVFNALAPKSKKKIA